MKSNKRTTAQQIATYVGIDPRDKKGQVCITDTTGCILKEFLITNTRDSLQKLAGLWVPASMAD